MPVRALRRVFLVGFMGSGKSTVGREVARRRGWEFIDLDEAIEQSAGRTISAIFEEHGEARFREIETAALQKLLASRSDRSRVVALGGGAFVHANNAPQIADAGGKVIFLDAPATELLRRCREQTTAERPLAKHPKRFHRLYEQRRFQYMTGTYRIDTYQRTVEQVADEIERYLGDLSRRQYG